VARRGVVAGRGEAVAAEDRVRGLAVRDVRVARRPLPGVEERGGVEADRLQVTVRLDGLEVRPDMRGVAVEQAHRQPARGSQLDGDRPRRLEQVVVEQAVLAAGALRQAEA
jgi:hypothetical protein